MFGKSILNAGRRAAADLLRNKRGNVAAIFALALVPMIGIVGAAIDYSRAVAARTAMQAALDTAALMVSKDAQANPTMTEAQATAAAQQYFNALYQNGGASGVVVEASFTPNTGQGALVQVVATGTVATDFMRMAGFYTINIDANSQTKWGNTRMRVAMVLDNTGSMADNSKMTKMKSAAKDMIDKLASFSNASGDVYISLIPFAKNVNLGSGFDKGYIKWSGQSDTWDENNGTCSAGSSYKTKSACVATSTCSLSGYNTQSKCTAAGSCSNSAYTSQNSCTSAGTCSNSNYDDESSCTGAMVCSNSSYTSRSKCTSHGGTWRSANYTWAPANNTWTAAVWGPATWTPNDHSTWNGCVMDRDQDNDIKNVAPIPGDTNTVSTLFPAQEYTQGSTNYCKTGSKTYLQPIIPMTENWTKLKDAIDDMDPTGGTNQAIGVAWGWQSLSTTNGPIAAPAKDANAIYQDYLVILSDGLNTQNRWPSYGNGQVQSTCNGQPCIDARQSKLCESIKAAGIKIFTIQVNIDKVDPTSTVLQNCASSAGNFQEIKSSDDIAGAFNTVLTQIANLRISQ